MIGVIRLSLESDLQWETFEMISRAVINQRLKRPFESGLAKSSVGTEWMAARLDDPVQADALVCVGK